MTTPSHHQDGLRATPAAQRIRINVLAPVNSNLESYSYVVTSEAQCRDAQDALAYKLTLEFGNTIALGCVITEILK